MYTCKVEFEKNMALESILKTPFVSSQETGYWVFLLVKVQAR